MDDLTWNNEEKHILWLINGLLSPVYIDFLKPHTVKKIKKIKYNINSTHKNDFNYLHELHESVRKAVENLKPEQKDNYERKMRDVIPVWKPKKKSYSCSSESYSQIDDSDNKGKRCFVSEMAYESSMNEFCMHDAMPFLGVL